MSELSTKPYLLRAMHEWCTDCGYTPYIAVSVDAHTRVPRDFVRAGEIVLNISMSATNRLVIGNDLIEFQARFNGRAQDLSVPVENVTAIYARENGHGMAFEVPKAVALVPDAADQTPSASAGDTGTAHAGSGAGSDAEGGGLAAAGGARRAPEPALPETPGKASNARPGLSVAGRQARPRLEAVSDSPVQATARNRRDDVASPPDDDPPPPVADNPDHAPGKPRGRPTLTRIK